MTVIDSPHAFEDEIRENDGRHLRKGSSDLIRKLCSILTIDERFADPLVIPPIIKRVIRLRCLCLICL